MNIHSDNLLTFLPEDTNMFSSYEQQAGLLIFAEMEAFLSWGKQEEVLLLMLCIEKQTLDFSWDLKKKIPLLFHLRASEFFLSVGRTETRTSHLDCYLSYIDACIIASQ